MTKFASLIFSGGALKCELHATYFYVIIFVCVSKSSKCHILFRISKNCHLLKSLFLELRRLTSLQNTDNVKYYCEHNFCCTHVTHVTTCCSLCTIEYCKGLIHTDSFRTE
jgi:hypothetical protein